MIDPDTCNAVVLLYQAGMAVREISRRLKISHNTARRIILQAVGFVRVESCPTQAVLALVGLATDKVTREYIKRKGVGAPSPRKDKIHIDRELLERLYRDCDQRVQRVHEKLLEEEGIQMGYSTLSRLLSELGISQPPKVRGDRVPDVPGQEMQHDTTVYRVTLSGRKIKVIASLVYLRYSKRKYLKFYRLFNRFAMKCFLHEALMYWRHAAGRCVIDNTNLARLRGTGKHAVIVPEMISFGRQYGFEFICHAIGHANRKERTKVASSHRESPKRRNADSLISPTSFNPREFALEIALTDQF